MALPTTLKILAAERRAADATRKVAALTAQLASAVESLHRTRALRAPAPLKPARRAARLKGDRIRLCIPDTHGAAADRPALAALLADAKSIAPHEVILLGDHVDCGGFLAQHHTLGYVAETDTSYEQDIAEAATFLDGLRAAVGAASIEYLEGNHERRVETWCVTQTLRHLRDAELLRRAVAPEFLLKLAEREIPYHRLSKCHDGLDVPGVIRRDNCYFFHGITTAKHAAFVTRVRTAGNCVFGHTHRAQSDVGRSLHNGITGVWNPGCLCRLQPLWNHGSPTDWTHGYGVQFISRTGKFLHLNVPIIGGLSLFNPLLQRRAA